MYAFIGRRFMQLIPTLFGITLITFLLVRMTGDPASLMLSQDAPPEAREQFRHEYGLDLPLHIQYARFVAHALRGDLGMSMRYREPVAALIWERLPATIELGLAALALAIITGIPLGVLSAVKKDTLIDGAVRGLTLVGQAVPIFYLGLMLIILFGATWKLLPATGRGTLRHLILPCITLATFQVAIVARFTRGAVLDVLRADYVRTARAKGVSEVVVLFRHVLKNAMIPIVTIVGLQIGGLLSGAVVTETVFAWPGIGRLMVQSIYTRDFPVVQAMVLLIAVSFVMANLCVDLMYAWLDPRIRYDR